MTATMTGKLVAEISVSSWDPTIDPGGERFERAEIRQVPYGFEVTVTNGDKDRIIVNADTFYDAAIAAVGHGSGSDITIGVTLRAPNGRAISVSSPDCLRREHITAAIDEFDTSN